MHKIRKIRDGKCLISGFFILKWKHWAANIKPPINMADKQINEGYQIPVTSNVAKAILDTPTRLRVKSFNPNVLNSAKTFWNLK